MIASFYVPVVDKDQNPLMPTILSRAKKWITSGKATPFWKNKILCVRLNVEPSGNEKQDIAVGVDPGSKKEGFTVKSKAHTFLNIQADAVTHVKDAIKTRRQMRSTRRNRNTPCRKPKAIQGRKLPPSTKARWQSKLNILKWLSKLYPVSHVVVEDIKARNKKKHNLFSVLECGKQWFYEEVRRVLSVDLILMQGYQTKELRDRLGLKKSKDKMSNSFDSHCVDSWVLTNSVVGGDVPNNRQVLCVTPIRLHRRQLHIFQPSKGGVRKPYGGTISLGLKRGSLVKHPKYGVVYVGGTSKNRISLHSYETGVRLCRNAKLEDCKFLAYNRRQAFLPYAKA